MRQTAIHYVIKCSRKQTRLAMTMVSTMPGVELVPRTNCKPRGGFPVSES